MAEDRGAALEHPVNDMRSKSKSKAEAIRRASGQIQWFAEVFWAREAVK